MTGNVVVDDLEGEEADPLRPSSGWLVVLAGIVVMTLALLPGSGEEEVPPTTLPEVVVAEDEWTRLDLPGAGALTDVASTPSGAYLAVGHGPQFWWSGNGNDWEWGDVEAEPGRAVAVTAAGEGGVAVGSTGEPGETGATIWTSHDGRNWVRSVLEAPVPSGLEGVEVTEEAMVAWGWVGASGMFDPDTGTLLLISTDGERWESVPVPEDGARLATVTHIDGRWFLGGFFVGRPAAWSSPDLEQWTRIPTDGLPFGWVMTRIEVNDGTVMADVTDLGRGRMRRWIQESDGSWRSVGRDVSGPTDSIDGDLGAGSGRLWVRVGGDWVPIDIEGSIEAVSGSVAVGETGLQPTLWLRNVGAEPAVSVEPAADGRWSIVEDLGEGRLAGAWPVGDGWLVAMSRQWWLVGGDSIEPIAAPTTDPPRRVVALGDEWVTLPSLYWTDDGISWVQRAEPWEGALETGAGWGVVMAATLTEEGIRVLGTDADRRWSVADSDDGGRTWSSVGEPTVTAPIWEVAGVPGGFVAVFARQGGTRDVVVSADGMEWEVVPEIGALLEANVPAVTTSAGGLLLLDTGSEVDPPSGTPDAIAREGDRVMIVAGNRLWVGPDEWEEIPLDPAHGMSAAVVHPLSVDGRLLVVASDRDRVGLYEWEP